MRITTQSRMFFVKSFKGLPSLRRMPGMQDWGHATTSENPSPAGKAQNCGPVRHSGWPSGHWWNVLMRIPVFGFKSGAAFAACFSACFRPAGHRQSLQCPAMELSERQRKYLRGLGHALNPVLLLGQHGVTPAVVAEMQRALHDHELIKVKFRGSDRDARDAGLAELATATGSSLVQRIGHTALYYKRRIDRPGIVIPDA